MPRLPRDRGLGRKRRRCGFQGRPSLEAMGGSIASGNDQAKLSLAVGGRNGAWNAPPPQIVGLPPAAGLKQCDAKSIWPIGANWRTHGLPVGGVDRSHPRFLAEEGAGPISINVYRPGHAMGLDWIPSAAE